MMLKLFKVIKNLNYSIQLKHKLLISYFILILIPLAVFTFLSYKHISQSVEDQSKYSAENILEQTASFIEYKVSNIIYVSTQISLDQKFCEILKRDENLPISPVLMQDYYDLNSTISKIFKNNDMYGMTIYINSNIYYSNESKGENQNYSFSSLENIEQEPWYKKLQNFDSKLLWIPSSQTVQTNSNDIKVVSAVRFIKYYVNNSYLENIGVLKIDLLKNDLNEIVKKANTTKNGVSFIQDSGGTILSASDESLADRYKMDKEYAFKLADSNSKWDTKNSGGEKVLIGSQRIGETDWVLVSIIPYNELLSSSKQTKNEMLSLMLIIAALAYILAFLISSSITQRIRSLIKRMKKVQSGDFSAIMTVYGKDELSELVKNFNYMINKMNEFIKLQYQSGQDIKNAELKVLQAQINPHFLYNTLELINWMAIKRGIPEISNIVQSLAKFYKLSLSKGADIIPIKDELNHAETYVKLQNYRFKNRIMLMIDMDQEIYQYSILKLILQPIIENSILHGILRKETKSGLIKIIGKVEDNSIRFTIEDDGIGMTDSQIKVILNNDIKGDHGYGIANINNRIKLYYGNQYGLSYRSIPGTGTFVELRIPISQLEINQENG